MQIYIALVSLQSTLARKNISLQDAPAYIRNHGFTGIEILDRQLARCTLQELKRLKQQCTMNSCGIIVDVSCDLTHASAVSGQAEIEHLRNMINKAIVLECKVVRITLGGQAFSIHRVLRRIRSDIDDGVPNRSSLKSMLSSALARRSGYLFRAFFSNFLTLNETKLKQANINLSEFLPMLSSTELL